MKLGISMWSFFKPYQAGKIDIPGFIHEAAKIGAEGVELLDFFYRERDLAVERRRAMDALDETGLICGVFSVSNNFAKADAADREIELEKIRFGIDEAKQIGASVVRVFAGNMSEGVTLEKAREWIVEGLVKASKDADSAGVRLALENHGLLAGRGDQVRGIVQDVRAISGSQALGANPDTGNFLLVNEVSDEAIRVVADLAYMVHFKDFALAPDGWEGESYGAVDGTKFVGTAVGEGAVNLPACLNHLVSAGFDGWVNVEYEAEEDPFTGASRSMVNARRLLDTALASTR